MRCSRLSSTWLAALLMATLATDVTTAAVAQETVEPDSLTLREAVARALESHPSIGAARAGVSAADATIGQATSDWWPTLAAQATLTTFDKPMLVAPLHELDVTQVQFENTLLQGNVALAWTLFDGGARRGRIRAARADAAGATAGRAATEMGLTAQVSVAYLRVLTARGVLDAEEQRTASLLAERRRVQQLLTQGRAAQVELLRVEAALAQAEAEQVATRTQLDLAERELARLIALPPTATAADRLVPMRLADVSAPEDRAALVERAISNSPELERARQTAAFALANRSVAKAAWIPNLDVSGAYQGFSSTDGNGSDLWSLGVALSYPLFTGGNRSSTVSRAGAQVQQANEELRLARLRVGDDLDRALNVALETRALVEALDRAVQHQTEVARIELLSLEAGAGTQTDYLRAEADLSRARSLLIQARHAEIAARVELARVVGELSPGWLDANLEAER